MKVEMFHTFYQRIESIQTAVINVPTIVVENIDFHTKIEDNKNTIEYDQMNQVDNKLEAIDKYDHHFDNNFWFDELDASMSEGMSVIGVFFMNSNVNSVLTMCSSIVDLKPETVTSDILELSNTVAEKRAIGPKPKSRHVKNTPNSALKNKTSIRK